MKCQRLLSRQGVQIPYGTLYRFAVQELGFGGTEVTVPVADGEPGKELQVDTGWMTLLEPDESGRRRRFKAFIFTPNVSRYRFVYPVFRERTEEAIEACEAAWEFYGGVFRVLIPDNTKAIVQTADPLEPLLSAAFLEYAQARGFHIDTARVRRPQRQRARGKKCARHARGLLSRRASLRRLEQARERALYWARSEYGMRRHSTTQRLPHEHFRAWRRRQLRPAPSGPYDIPLWCDPKVGRDHLAQVAWALYSLPTRWIGTQRAGARRPHAGALLLPRRADQDPPAQGCAGSAASTPPTSPTRSAPTPCATSTYLQRQATACGPAVGRFAAALLAGPLPWTRMRRVYALLRLVRRYGEARVDATCATALAHQMLNVTRLENMLKNPLPPRARGAGAGAAAGALSARPAPVRAAPASSPNRTIRNARCRIAAPQGENR